MRRVLDLNRKPARPAVAGLDNGCGQVQMRQVTKVGARTAFAAAPVKIIGKKMLSLTQFELDEKNRLSGRALNFKTIFHTCGGQTYICGFIPDLLEIGRAS